MEWKKKVKNYWRLKRKMNKVKKIKDEKKDEECERVLYDKWSKGYKGKSLIW